jgi:hypothetical protein
VAVLSLMPEWHLVTLALGAIGLAGLAWTPLFAALAISGLAVGISVLQAMLAGVRSASPQWRRRPRLERIALVARTSVLHLVQPLARLSGRLRHGLSPWRVRGPRAAAPLLRRSWTLWSERWLAFDAWLSRLERLIAAMDLVAVRGGDYDTWDLEVRGGLLAGVRVRAAVEEHGAGRQLLRFRVRSRPSGTALALLAVLGGGVAAAAFASAWDGAAALALLAGLIAARACRDCLVAAAAVRQATLQMEREMAAEPRHSTAPVVLAEHLAVAGHRNGHERVRQCP